MALQGILNTNTKATAAPVVTLAHGLEAPDTIRLTAALQITLELDGLLQIFSEHLKEHVNHSGLTYRNDERHFVIAQGQTTRHRCNYRLNLLGQELGEITVHRARRFAEQDLARIEYLLCALVYPLRNALLYREAISAAHRDPLTGLGNRAAWEESLARETSLAQRHGGSLTTIAIDIDFFKRINDCHGHSVGDCVLRTVAQRIAATLRGSDQVFRYGGEEFVVLLRNTDLVSATQVAERIRQAVCASPCGCEGATIPVTISLGVAELHQETPLSLFDRADHALYCAKENGRNRVEVAC